MVYDVVIIGGGPGGYAAALYAHNFGLKVALVEKERVGGTCLLRGCIPAKSWLKTAEVFAHAKKASEFGVHVGEPTLDWEAALNRKNVIVDGLVRGLSGLLKSRQVDVIEGYGRLAGGGVEVAAKDGAVRRLEAKNVVLATGSKPRSIPGYDFDGTRIVSSREALDWSERPNRVAIIGAGAIGSEFALILGSTGSEVHLFEMLDQVIPGAEPEAAKALAREMKKKGVKIRTGVGVGPAEVGDERVVVPFEGDYVEVDKVLVAVGRAPVTDDLGLETTRVEVDRGFIEVDPNTMMTAEPNIYAVGDIVAGTPQLAHAGFAEGIAAITHIATGEIAPVDYRAIPLVVYTDPELASVGLTEAAAREAGYDVEVHDHGMRGVGRAIIQGEVGGLVKVVSEKDGPILGATVIGPSAGELIHELMYAVAWEALPAEAAAFIHAHPTISEAIGETLLSAAGRSLH
ncbi:MAG: dihydrolipoyl dehydrogenase [Acidimicrobiia bacterium]|nr:dihydrolipoyl dehydrogenase [Acidimicrobiia bacterium]